MTHPPSSPELADDAKLEKNDATTTGSLEEGHLDDAESTAAYRKLLHRIDKRLVLTTGFMYCVSLIDRTNIGSANIAGMGDDLGLDEGYRYVSTLSEKGMSFGGRLTLRDSRLLRSSSSSRLSSLSRLRLLFAERWEPRFSCLPSPSLGASSWSALQSAITGHRKVHSVLTEFDRLASASPATGKLSPASASSWAS
jgi:hypothetical protein